MAVLLSEIVDALNIEVLPTATEPEPPSLIEAAEIARFSGSLSAPFKLTLLPDCSVSKPPVPVVKEEPVPVASKLPTAIGPASLEPISIELPCTLRRVVGTNNSPLPELSIVIGLFAPLAIDTELA